MSNKKLNKMFRFKFCAPKLQPFVDLLKAWVGEMLPPDSDSITNSTLLDVTINDWLFPRLFVRRPFNTFKYVLSALFLSGEERASKREWKISDEPREESNPLRFLFYFW